LAGAIPLDALILQVGRLIVSNRYADQSFTD